MSDRSPSIGRSWVLAAALIVATGGAASVGPTQQVTGSIGVSLTILPPVADQPLRVTRVSVSRDGVARFETTAPTSARTSQLLMASVSSSATGFAPEPQPPALVPASRAESRLRYLVNVGHTDRSVEARPVEVRVQFLMVAGT